MPSKPCSTTAMASVRCIDCFFAFILRMLSARVEHNVSIGLPVLADTIALAFLAHGTVLFSIALMIVIAAALFWFAFLRHQVFDQLRRIPDVSYGIYIDAFPIQQTFAMAAPGWSPLVNAVASLTCTLPFAVMSWYLTEKPALGLHKKPPAWASLLRSRA